MCLCECVLRTQIQLCWMCTVPQKKLTRYLCALAQAPNNICSALLYSTNTTSRCRCRFPLFRFRCCYQQRPYVWLQMPKHSLSRCVLSRTLNPVGVVCNNNNSSTWMQIVAFHVHWGWCLCIFKSRIVLNSALECGACIGFQSGEFHRSIALAQWKRTHKGAMQRGCTVFTLEYTYRWITFFLWTSWKRTRKTQISIILIKFLFNFHKVFNRKFISHCTQSIQFLFDSLEFT